MVTGNTHEGETSGTALRANKDLLIATVARATEERGIRCLAAGGSIFAAHGLISPRVAPTVSFLVAPPALAAIVRLLREAGWHTAPTRRSGILPYPVVLLVHDDWIAGIRLHSVIPGFFVDPVVVFDELWAGGGTMRVRDARVHIVSKLATAMFAAHDRLTGVRARSGHGVDLGFFLLMFTRAFSPTDCEKLLALTHAVGGEDEMREFLEGLGCDPGSATVPSVEYARWRLALDDVTDADRWLLARLEVRRSQWRELARQLPDRGGPVGAIRALARFAGASARVARRDGTDG